MAAVSSGVECAGVLSQLGREVSRARGVEEGAGVLSEVLLTGVKPFLDTMSLIYDAASLICGATSLICNEQHQRPHQRGTPLVLPIIRSIICCQWC